MKKAKHLFIASAPLLIAILIAYLLYSNIPTTPVVILILFLLFISIVLSFGLYKKGVAEEDVLEVLSCPELEEGLIYITPYDFATKSDPAQGKLFIAGSSYQMSAFDYTNSTYKKLTDELTISFKPQLSLVIKGIKTIGVGDYQFCIFGFSEMELIKNKKRIATYTWNDDNLSITTDGTVKKVQLEDGGATLVFEWETLLDLE